MISRRCITLCVLNLKFDNTCHMRKFEHDGEKLRAIESTSESRSAEAQNELSKRTEVSEKVVE